MEFSPVQPRELHSPLSGTCWELLRAGHAWVHHCQTQSSWRWPWCSTYTEGLSMGLELRWEQLRSGWFA